MESASTRRLGSPFQNEAKMTILVAGMNATQRRKILIDLELATIPRHTWLVAPDEIPKYPDGEPNVVTFKLDEVLFTVWHGESQDKHDALWRRYPRETQAIIFAVDTATSGGTDRAKEELNRILAEEKLRDARLLVVGRNRHYRDAMSADEIANKLDLHSLENRDWKIEHDALGALMSLDEAAYEARTGQKRDILFTWPEPPSTTSSSG